MNAEKKIERAVMTVVNGSISIFFFVEFMLGYFAHKLFGG